MDDNIDKIINDLWPNSRGDDEVLEEILEEVSSIASDISNRQKDDEKLFPYFIWFSMVFYFFIFGYIYFC